MSLLDVQSTLIKTITGCFHDASMEQLRFNVASPSFRRRSGLNREGRIQEDETGIFLKVMLKAMELNFKYTPNKLLPSPNTASVLGRCPFACKRSGTVATAVLYWVRQRVCKDLFRLFNSQRNKHQILLFIKKINTTFAPQIFLRGIISGEKPTPWY